MINGEFVDLLSTADGIFAYNGQPDFGLDLKLDLI
jgi:hypothetical protein